jgi:PhzF family phenazine biosynthesis protein
MKQRYYVADAFADHVFEGNPAGVCILDKWLPEGIMKSIAMENNLSETGFAVKAVDVPTNETFQTADQ